MQTYAAARLAAAWPKDAAPAIMAAYATETFPWSQVHLAWTAARLGDASAVTALVGICKNSAWQPNLRTDAAQAAMQSGQPDCLGNVINLLESSSEDSEVVIALSVLQVWQNMPSWELREVREFVPTLLRSKSFGVQGAATDFLGRLGDSSSADQLKSALSTEQVKFVRDAMNSALKWLEAKEPDAMNPK